MIVLDTNVVSEPLRAQPDPVVADWLDAQDPQTLFLPSICLAELLAGVEALPEGRRRRTLEAALGEQLMALFSGRILPFDERAARAFAKVSAAAQATGNPISFADAAIAAIAAANGCILATRNVRDFRGTGVKLVDPWTADA